ncbi:MAG: hypothetical protein M1836_005956 [Candelina mexicana]|nr:MAG: hypothetical protein M1836_005956 [Candelina mexicana]
MPWKGDTYKGRHIWTKEEVRAILKWRNDERLYWSEIVEKVQKEFEWDVNENKVKAVLGKWVNEEVLENFWTGKE